DAGTADRTIISHAFGLRTPAPLWTAPAFDRCLLLALVYPIAAIFGIWAISGHVGPAEASLGLRSGLPAWDRGVAVAAVALAPFSFWRFTRTSGWRRVQSMFACLLGFIATATSSVGAFAIALAGVTVVNVRSWGVSLAGISTVAVVAAIGVGAAVVVNIG